MKLLQHSWSDMLVLDHLHQRMHNNLPDETTLHNGQKFDLLSLGLLGVPSLADHFNDITAKLQDLKFDVGDYICVKFLLLLNPGMYYFASYKIGYVILQFVFDFFLSVIFVYRCTRNCKSKARTRRIWTSTTSTSWIHSYMLPASTGM